MQEHLLNKGWLMMIAGCDTGYAHAYIDQIISDMPIYIEDVEKPDKIHRLIDAIEHLPQLSRGSDTGILKE